jgi:hypothetical protein
MVVEIIMCSEGLFFHLNNGFFKSIFIFNKSISVTLTMSFNIEWFFLLKNRTIGIYFIINVRFFYGRSVIW